MDSQPVEEIGFKEIKIFDEEIGCGSYGSVHKAMCDNLLCAAKRIHIALIGPPNTTPSKRNHRIPIRRFEAEFQFLQELRHPNIIQYLGMYRDSTYKQPVLLMELMEESLTDYIERATNAIPYHTQVNVCHDITRALSHLHINEIVHRDLSSNNILLSGNPCKAKLSDFGMAKFLNVRMSRVTGAVSNTAMPGTEAYMPPEALDGHDKFRENGDIFSFGVIIVQILTREFPHPGDRFTYVQVNNQRRRACVPEIERRQNHLSLIQQDHQLLPVVFDCLQDMESDRPNAADLCVRLASFMDTTLYKECVEAEENPPKPVTEDKSVNTDMAPPYTVVEDIVDDIEFSSITVNKTSHKVARLQEAIKQKEDEIQGNKETLKAMQLLLDIKEQSLRNLSEQNDELSRTQEEQEKSLQAKESLLKALSQDKENLINNQTELKENFDAQLCERNEQVFKFQQQLDQQAQQISDKDHRIAQQQERIDVLESDLASQVTSSKKKKSHKKKKEKEQALPTPPSLSSARIDVPKDPLHSGTNGSSLVKVKSTVPNTKDKPHQTSATQVHLDAATNYSISQHVADDLPPPSLAGTEKQIMSSTNSEVDIISNDTDTSLSAIKSSQPENVAKTRVEAATARSVTLPSDTQRMAKKTTETLQQQVDSTSKIKGNHDTSHVELQTQTAKPESARVKDKSQASDVSSETQVKKSSSSFFSFSFLPKKKSKHEAKKKISKPEPHSTKQVSSQEQPNSTGKLKIASLKRVSPVSQRTSSREQQQLEALQIREKTALTKMEESSGRALRTLRDTERLGVATNEELVHQSEALGRIEERHDVIDSRISRGKQSATPSSSRLDSTETVTRKPVLPGSSSGKLKPSNVTSPLHQYKSTGSKVVDDHLDEMSRLLTNLAGIGQAQSDILDQQDTQLGRIKRKAENNHYAFQGMNSELEKQL